MVPRRFSVIVAAFALAAAAPATAVFAGSAVITVAGTVSGTCKVNSSPTVTLVLDPTTTGPVTGTGSISLWCTKGTPFTITDPGSGSSGSYTTTLVGNDGVTGNIGQTIPIQLSYGTNGTGKGKTTVINSPVSVTAAFNDFRFATPGTYARDVILSISP